jgi:uncharacterized RDD family membrane protein YckC
MQSIRIQTSQNIELEYELAGVGDRLVAYLIDVLIYIAYGIIIFMISLSVKGIGGPIWTQFLVFLPILFYQLLCEVFLNGQSFGKRAKHIRVISLDGNQPGLGQYLIRWIFRIVDTMISQGIVAIITIALSKKAQRIGDMLAGTTVVRIRPSTYMQDTIFTETRGEHQVLFPQVTQLNDQDIALLKEVVNRYRSNPAGSGIILDKAYHKIREILSIKEEYEPLPFIENIIGDYNHLTGKDHENL